MKFEIITVTNLKQNCILIWDEITLNAIIIDPGGDIEKIINAIKQWSLKLICILLTHGHIDHVGGAKKLATYFSVLIYGPGKKDDFLIKNLDTQSKIFSVVNHNNFIPDYWLNDGDDIHIENIFFKTRLCPGHTPGHVVYINNKDKLVLVGDVLFKGGIGRTDFPGGNFNVLIHSIKQVLLTLDDDYQVIPGHGPITYIGVERQYNPFLSNLKKYSI